MNKDIGYLLAIARGCGLTWRRYEKLNTFFEGDFKAAYQASWSDWRAAGVDSRGCDKFFATQTSPDQECSRLAACGAQVLVCGQEDYPLSLNTINPPPVLLFVRGKIRLSDSPAIGVVGSRKVTDYGRTTLDFLLKPTINQGVTTVSGLAFGVDRLVHECSLKAGQRTLAVLGGGIDQIYPKSHERLAHQIVDQGALISEYLPGTKPRAEFFPQRNRIISGLAKAVVLVEAAEKSGTLITAAWANEQGRDIFAIPGNIFATQSQGTNNLIAQGLATALVHPDQLENLFPLPKKEVKADWSDLSAIDRSILELLAKQSPLQADEIIRSLNWPSAVVSSQLMLLEVQGWIKDTGQQLYTSQL